MNASARDQFDCELDLGKDLAPGARHYRAFVGQPERYDLRAAVQFNILTELGMREEHQVLDIGCGSLRVGRLLIPYLLPGRYCAVEPEQWLVEDGIRHELGQSIVALKKPRFDFNREFEFAVFDRTFDFAMAQSIFTHAAGQQIERCLQNAAAVLKPTGILVATFVEGARSYCGSAWQYPQCISYPFEFFAEAAERSNLICRRFPWPDPTGFKWLVFHSSEYSGWDAVCQDHSGTFRDYLRLNEKVAGIGSELEQARCDLTRILNHPYVVFGLRMRRLLKDVLGT